MSGGCCSNGPANDWEGMFGERMARNDLRAYRRSGPSTSTRRLLDAISAQPGALDGASTLDVGGGVGAISFELLERGVASATQVDASSAYLAAAAGEAERRHVADRATFVHGDAVAMVPDLPDADIVTLDRVICCDPRLDALVRATAARSRGLYGLVYPHDAWWTRAIARAQQAVARLVRWRFTFWVHPTARLDALLDELGFERRLRQRVGPFWEVALFARR